MLGDLIVCGILVFVDGCMSHQPAQLLSQSKLVDPIENGFIVIVVVCLSRELARLPSQSMLGDLIVCSILVFVVGCLSREPAQLLSQSRLVDLVDIGTDIDTDFADNIGIDIGTLECDFDVGADDA